MELELAISQIIFYLFALLAIVGAVGVIAMRNLVSSAMSMALCFLSVAAIYFGMGAEFMGIVQIIVYAGAILVLFLFVVMMLDIKKEEKTRAQFGVALVGTIIAGIFSGMIASLSLALPDAKAPQANPICVIVDEVFSFGDKNVLVEECCMAKASSTGLGGPLPALKADAPSDIELVGQTLFSQYNIALVILSFALLAACVGAISLSRSLRKN